MAVSETATEKTLQLFANPLLIQDKQLSLFEERVFGGRSVLDGNNVFTFGLEMGATMTANIVNEMTNCFSSLYPARAQTMADLYRHMSDYDYIDMFSTPSSTTIELMFDRDYLINNAPQDADDVSFNRVVIPEFSVFTIGEHQFGIHYPIEIRIRKAYKTDGKTIDYDNTLFQCVWDTTTVNPLYRLTSNVLEHRMYHQEGLNMLCISIPVYQFTVTTFKDDSVSSTGFVKRYPYLNRFYAIRVFHYQNEQWVEMSETLSDVIYNPSIPTANVKVLSDIHMVEVSIPQVYFTNNMIGNRIMCLLYTTEGELDIDIRNYKADQFSASFLVDDKVVDDTYSAFLKRIPTLQVIPLNSRISNGSNGKTFAQMKNRVVNTIGGDDLLVTPQQISAHITDMGFNVYKYIDNITQRIYIASRVITDSNKNVIAAGEFMTTITSDMLKKAGYDKEYNTIRVIDDLSTNNDAHEYLVMPDTIFKYDSITDSMIPLSRYEVKHLLQDSTTEEMIEYLNSDTYTWTPFHVKISTTDDLPIAGVYDLLEPNISNLTFSGENTSTNTQVSMYGHNIQHLGKGTEGYRLMISLYKTSDLSNIKVYDDVTAKENIVVILRTKSSDETPIFLKGEYYGENADGKDLIRFDIKTDYRLQSNDTIDSTAFTQINEYASGPSRCYLPLNHKYELLFFAKKDLVPGEEAMAVSNSIADIPKEVKSLDMVWLATQTIDIELGKPVSSLKSNMFVTIQGEKYNTYDTTTFATYISDVFKRYEVNVTDADGTEHFAGDFVLDENGDLIIEKYAGDIIITPNEDAVVGGRGPAYQINRISKDSNGDDVTEKEILYLDSDQMTANAEVTNSWNPYRVYQDWPYRTYEERVLDSNGNILHEVGDLVLTDTGLPIYDTTKDSDADGKPDKEWKAIYTGYKKLNTDGTFSTVYGSIVKVNDLMKSLLTQIETPDELGNYPLKLDVSNDRVRGYTKTEASDGTVTYTLEPAINGGYIFVEDDSTNSVEIPKYLVSRNEQDGTCSMSLFTARPDEVWCAIYRRDVDASNFDYTQYLTENELCQFYERYDVIVENYGSTAKKTSDYLQLIDDFNVDSDVADKLLKFRAPWIKLIEAESYDDIKTYYTHRQLLNFNDDLIIYGETENTDSLYDTVGYPGVAGLGYIQSRSLNKNMIQKYSKQADGIRAADGDTSYRLIWVDSYDPALDTTCMVYDDRNLPVALVEAADIPAGKTRGALLWGAHGGSASGSKHYLVASGPSLEYCYEKVMSYNTYSGLVYECSVKDTSAQALATLNAKAETTYKMEFVYDKLIEGLRIEFKTVTGESYIPTTESEFNRICSEYFDKLPTIATYVSIVSVDTTDTISTDQVDLNLSSVDWNLYSYWPWESANWMTMDGKNVNSSNVTMMLNTTDSDARILHAYGEIQLDESGLAVVHNDDNKRKLIYHVDMLHCDYKLLESEETEYIDHRSDVQELLRSYFELLDATKPQLLERTELYYAPVRSMGTGMFKGANGDTIEHPLEITVTLRLHVAASFGASEANKETIRNNVLTILEQHISSGSISCAVLANEIRNQLSDTVLYVDVLGINGNPDVQTLISDEPSKSAVRLKSVLTLDKDGKVSVEKGLTIVWSLMR